MTRESQEIAEAVDPFPGRVREAIRDATVRLVEVYEATAKMRPRKPKRRASGLAAAAKVWGGAKVIRLADRRQDVAP